MLWLLPLTQAHRASLCWLWSSGFTSPHTGPSDVLTAAVVNAVRQAGAGCSRSCTVGASTLGTALA